MLSKWQFWFLAEKETTTTHVKLLAPERKASKEDKDEWQQHQSSTTVQLHFPWKRFKCLHCRNLNRQTHTYISIYNESLTHIHINAYTVHTTYSVRASMPLLPSMSSSISLERLPSTRVTSSSRGTVNPSMPNKQPLKRDRRFSILTCLWRI